VLSWTPYTLSHRPPTLIAHTRPSHHQADFQAPGDYMENLERDINAQMRGILIDWIVEAPRSTPQLLPAMARESECFLTRAVFSQVGEMYNLHDQTIYLCTNYLDRYVATHAVPRSCLQLVGVTCLQIASKYSEVSCPTGEQFAYISVTPIEEIMKMERKILDALDYRLCVVSVRPRDPSLLPAAAMPSSALLSACLRCQALDFCAHYCRACEASEVTTMLARVPPTPLHPTCRIRGGHRGETWDPACLGSTLG
jgi:hypothetical protein